jgi:hypothetical protein
MWISSCGRGMPFAPAMIQINFPISGTMAFVIHFSVALASNLNGDFWEMVNGIKSPNLRLFFSLVHNV